MRDKIVMFAAFILLGVTFGLMFNAVQKTVLLAEHIVARQGEFIDFLRVEAKHGAELEATFADMSREVKTINMIVKKLYAPLGRAQQRPQKPPEDFSKVYEIPVGDSIVIGDLKAPVTIVGFLDIQCPFSKRFQTMIDQALEVYPGKVKYVVKHFPLGFHKEAASSAKAVLAADEQGKFYEMLKAVLENNHQLSAEKYDELAKGLGLDMEKFKKTLEEHDKAWTRLIQEDFRLGQKIDVRGTPTYFLNGKKMRSRTAEALKKEIEAILGARK